MLNICPEKRLNQMILNPNTVQLTALLNPQLNRLIESLEDHFVTVLTYCSPNALHIPPILYTRTTFSPFSPRSTGPDSPAPDVLSFLAISDGGLSLQLRLLRLLGLLLHLSERLRRVSAADQPAVARQPPVHERGGLQPEGRTDGLHGPAGAAEADAGGDAAVGAARQGDRGARVEGDRRRECASRERSRALDAETRRSRSQSQAETVAYRSRVCVRRRSDGVGDCEGVCGEEESGGGSHVSQVVMVSVLWIVLL